MVVSNLGQTLGLETFLKPIRFVDFGTRWAAFGTSWAAFGTGWAAFGTGLVGFRPGGILGGTPQDPSPDAVKNTCDLLTPIFSIWGPFWHHFGALWGSYF